MAITIKNLFIRACQNAGDEKIYLGVCLCFPQNKIPYQLFDEVIKAVRAPHYVIKI